MAVRLGGCPHLDSSATSSNAGVPRRFGQGFEVGWVVPGGSVVAGAVLVSGSDPGGSWGAFGVGQGDGE